MKNEEVYRKLKESLTDEEIADAAVIPADLTESERKEAEEEIKSVRLQQLRTMSEHDRMVADVMRLRFRMENYVKLEPFSYDYTFGSYLQEYVRILKKDRKEIADDLAIHYTKLSRILNDKEEPATALCYRLDEYSGHLISADLWWKLMIKKLEFKVLQDENAKKLEAQKVKNSLITTH